MIQRFQKPLFDIRNVISYVIVNCQSWKAFYRLKLVFKWPLMMLWNEGKYFVFAWKGSPTVTVIITPANNIGQFMSLLLHCCMNNEACARLQHAASVSLHELHTPPSLIFNEYLIEYPLEWLFLKLEYQVTGVSGKTVHHWVSITRYYSLAEEVNLYWTVNSPPPRHPGMNWTPQRTPPRVV